MDNVLMNYTESIIKAMSLLSKNKKTVFIGQSVQYPGNLIFKTLKHIPKSKKIEMPVFEDVQMGMAIGMALNGYLPVACYPRFDFLLLGFNQMINHLDKIKEMTNNRYNPKVIIRVLVGSKIPLDAGPQHTQDYSRPLKIIFNNIDVYRMTSSSSVLENYKKAIKSNRSSLMVEYSNKI